jgi:hypothetical protein
MARTKQTARLGAATNDSTASSPRDELEHPGDERVPTVSGPNVPEPTTAQPSSHTNVHPVASSERPHVGGKRPRPRLVIRIPSTRVVSDTDVPPNCVAASLPDTAVPPVTSAPVQQDVAPAAPARLLLRIPVTPAASVAPPNSPLVFLPESTIPPSAPGSSPVHPPQESSPHQVPEAPQAQLSPDSADEDVDEEYVLHR